MRSVGLGRIGGHQGRRNGEYPAPGFIILTSSSGCKTSQTTGIRNLLQISPPRKASGITDTGLSFPLPLNDPIAPVYDDL